MDEDISIRVNFGRPMPVFPLDSAVLLPHQVLPLHIFEPRYRQMIDEALDSAGQIAMAVFDGDDWQQAYGANPPLKPYVCVGQIVQHESLPDGRYNVLLQGVCRARVVEPDEPEGERLYRRAVLEPVGVREDDDEASGEADELRAWVEHELARGRLRKLTVAEHVLQYVRNEQIPSPAVLELVSFAVLTDSSTRYRLLSEETLRGRNGIVREALSDLGTLIGQASAQHPERWPKGLSWN